MAIAEINIVRVAGGAHAALMTHARTKMRAMVSALNRTAQRAQTTAVRAMQENLAASSQKTIRRGLFIRRASDAKAEAVIGTRGKQIPVYELSPKPKIVAKRRPKIGGVAWGKRQQMIPSSFVAKLESGHVGVFIRSGAPYAPTRGRYAGQKITRGPRAGEAVTRQGIYERHGPSAALVFQRKKVQAAIKTTIREAFPVEFKRATAHFGRR